MIRTLRTHLRQLPFLRTQRALGQGAHAVILGAGRGSRLGALTEKRPKCLLEIGERSLLEHQLALLQRFGFERITVVTGYRAGLVERTLAGRAQVVHNAHWNDTNSAYSLWLCRDFVRSPLLVMNCDVLLHPQILQRILAQSSSAFAYDSSSCAADDEQMKVELCNNFLSAMGKCMPSERSHGENVGVLYFDAWAAHVLFREAGKLVGNGGRHHWLAAAVERVAEYVPLHGVDISDLPWIEIDFPEDLERARQHVWPAICGSPQRLVARSGRRAQGLGVALGQPS